MESLCFVHFLTTNVRYRNVNNCCYAKSVLRALFSLEDMCLDLESRLADISETPPTLFDLFVKLMREINTDEDEKVVDFLHGFVLLP